MMKFSILIANYNNGKYFEDCYKSIINQTFENWEVIILDDASTDNSVEVIKKIIGIDERFTLHEHPKNEGVGVIKAKLIELAYGEICCFVDPDDTIASTALEKHLEVLNKHKDVVLTYSRLMKCDENLNPISEFKAAMQVPNGDRNFFNCPVQIAPLVCFRKDVYLTTQKMNPRFRIAEDQDLYFKMYEKGKVKFINQTDYFYRAHSGGISQNENKQKSYAYFAECIYEAMQRRKITQINGVEIPNTFPGTEKIFQMLEYKNNIVYRIKKKTIVFFQKLF